MKAIINVLCLGAFLGPYAAIGGPTDLRNAEKDVLDKQKALFELLQHPHQPGVSIFKPEHLDIVKSFDFEESYDSFHPDAVDNVREFYQMYKKGLLIPSNELFSIYNYNHRRQAIALFHVFYNANGEEKKERKNVLWFFVDILSTLSLKQVGMHSTRQFCGLVTMLIRDFLFMRCMWLSHIGRILMVWNCQPFTKYSHIISSISM